MTALNDKQTAHIKGIGKIMECTKFPDMPEKEIPTTSFDSLDPIEISSPNLRDFPFSMGEIYENIRIIRRLPKSYFKKMKKIRSITAEFSDKHIRPVAAEIEKRVAKDPDYFPADIIKKTSKYRFSTLVVPEAFGGPGYYSVHSGIMAEEIAVGCAGLATTIAVSSAGSSQVLLAFDMHLIARYMRESVKAEKRGDPILYSGAVTEPNAGTDRWDEEFQNQNRAGMVAKKVEGGYILNGSKCFISNGSVSKYAIITAALDPQDVRGSLTGFFVPTDTKGFSIGRIERKMGQKASPTTEQICEDVFVPSCHMLGLSGSATHGITLYLAASRGPVGAIGVGCGRRALESLIRWATERKNSRGRLIDQQALQLTISKMAQELAIARSAYITAGIAFDEMMYNILSKPEIKMALHLIPKFIFRSTLFGKITQSNLYKKIMDKYLSSAFTEDKLLHAANLAAIAKIAGSTAGVNVAGEAMRIMGPDAADPEWSVDKAYRDAKLTQIYEGTNQACAITSFKSMFRSRVNN